MFTYRGVAPATERHEQLQFSVKSPNRQYAIVDFQVRPQSLELASTCSGILTMSKNDNIDPLVPTYSDNSEIAWAKSSTDISVPPALGEVPSFFSDSVVDQDRLFNYDLWLHTQEVTGNVQINWIITLAEFRTTSKTGAISSLRQFLMAPVNQ